MTIYSITNKGKRKANEDNFFVADFRSASDSESTKPEDSIVALCVCDGMGGQAAGRFFSWYVCQRVHGLDLGGSTSYIGESLYEIHKEAVEFNLKFIRNGYLPEVDGFEWSAEDRMKLKQGVDGGTTCTLAIFDGRSGMITTFNIGDSRAYLVGSSNISQITTDDAAPANAEGKKSSKLTRCMGINTKYTGKTGNWDDIVTVKSMSFNADYDEGILVCSDGFYNRINSQGFLRTLQSRGGEEALSENLDVVYGRGERDNATAVLWSLGG